MNHTPFNTTYTIPPWGYSSMYRSTKTLTTTSTRRGTHSGRPLSQKSLTQCPSSAPTRRPSILESPANTFSRTKTRKLRRNSATLSPCLATPHAVFFFLPPSHILPILLHHIVSAETDWLTSLASPRLPPAKPEY